MNASEARKLAVSHGAKVSPRYTGEMLLILNRIKDKCLSGELSLLYNPIGLSENVLHKILLTLQENEYTIKYTDFGYTISWD